MSEYLSIGLSFGYQIQEAHQEFRQKTIDAWKKTFDMPRKKKKKIRKNLILDFKIISFTESDDFYFSSLFK